jgi:hypothetical protein
MKTKILGIVTFLFLSLYKTLGQDKLYPNTFFGGDVKLLEGPFKKAQDLNVKTLLKYDINRLKESQLSFMVRYKGNETGAHQFDILIDGQKLTTENPTGKWNKAQLINVEYQLPDSMLAGKDKVEVRFQAASGNSVGEEFYVRILRNESFNN